MTWFRAVIAALLAAAIAVGVYVWLGGEPTVTVVLPGAHEVELLAPRWLYLLALWPFVWLVVGASLTDLSAAQRGVQVALRGLIISGIAVALARPATVADDTKVATVFLVDASASISDKQLAAAQGYVDAAWKAKAADDKAFLVAFGSEPILLRAESGPPRLARPGGDGGKESDLQAALQLAYGLVPPGYLPRVVVLSDGNQTRGDFLAEAYKAKELGVRVSYQVFPEDRRKDVRLVSLRLPEEVKVGAPFEIVAEVWSTHAQEATLMLRQDDFPNPLEPQKTVQLREGKNRVTFKAEAKSAGFSTYRLRLKDLPAADDESRENNETVATAPVKGRPRVLYIEGEYDRDPSVASHLSRALDKENIDVEVRGARGLPSSAKELERYDLVLVSDVSSMFMGLGQMQAIEGYVRDLGGGFIMTGGQDSFSSGGYQGTRIEKILPVRFEGEKDMNQAQIALALVIDRSGSMNGEKMEMAKVSAGATASALDPRDLITVIAFDNVPMTIVRLQRASNQMRITSDIAKIQPGGGTNILPALQEAYNALAPSSAKVKHVILLSDGQAALEGIAEVVDEMRANRITVSAVGIGDADRSLLQMVAEHGEGRYYVTEDASELPKIFMKETEEVQRSSLVEDAVTITVMKRVEAIEGVGIESAPPLKGYVSTKAKDLSEVILVSQRGEPILARWRLGLGQVVAWTSDVKARWAAEWVTWGGYQRFWAQLVRATMRHQQHESYDLSAEIDSGRARVVVDAVDRDDRFVNGLDTTLEVIDPRDSKVKKTLPMVQTAAGRYEADLAIDRYGSFLFKAVHRREGNVVAESVGAVALPYPREFLLSTPDETVMRQAATITGGSAKPAPDATFARLDEKIEYRRDLWPWVLLGVAMAWVLDVYLRRVRLFGHRAARF
jgi:Ca-activated chloride channel homolog